MFNLGAMYERGVGVAADPDKAKAWYGLAAAHGDTGAKAALKRLGG
jgi:TPR repeat protein